MKMCLATRISRSKESADFSNVIPVVAVGDMIASVFVVKSSSPFRKYGGKYPPRCCSVLLSERPRSRPRADLTNARSGRVSKTCSSSKFRIAHCREYKERLELNVRMY